jgi:predicted ferric reductase
MQNESHWMDSTSLVFSLFVIALAGVWVVHTGTLETSLTASNNATWYLIRSFGITSYIMLTLSVMWGLALSSAAVKNWSPGPLTMLIHSTISWLSLAFGMVHGLLLMVDKYFTYKITDVLIPFAGPYRPLAVGLGTTAFWILVIVTPSFALKKRLFSYRAWKTLHYMSYVAFLLVTAHALTAGTDAKNIGFRLLLGLSLVLTVILLGYRIGIKQAAGSKPNHARPPAARAVAEKSPSESPSTRHPLPQGED